MRAADVPTVPGTEGATTLQGARAAAAEIGYPVMLKATAGGGGTGHAARRRSRRARGPLRVGLRQRRRRRSANGTLYVEKVLSPARHVEIQVLCDAHGNVLTLGERECSIQRRHQKLIEESPSAGADARAARGDGGGGGARVPRRRLPERRDVRVPLGPDGTFSFIELNARLQVEHPVTELCTGIDLVREPARRRRGRGASR